MTIAAHRRPRPRWRTYALYAVLAVIALVGASVFYVVLVALGR